MLEDKTSIAHFTPSTSGRAGLLLRLGFLVQTPSVPAAAEPCECTGILSLLFLRMHVVLILGRKVIGKRSYSGAQFLKADLCLLEL